MLLSKIHSFLVITSKYAAVGLKATSYDFIAHDSQQNTSMCKSEGLQSSGALPLETASISNAATLMSSEAPLPVATILSSQNDPSCLLQKGRLAKAITKQPEELSSCMFPDDGRGPFPALALGQFGLYFPALYD